MQKILLARGKVALVDDRDYGYLMQWKWYAHKSYDAFYVRRNIPVNGKEKDKRMHRIIMCVPKGMFVDHINHNTLDNRRENLRICTQSQNSHNAVLSTRNSSGYKGV